MKKTVIIISLIILLFSILNGEGLASAGNDSRANIPAKIQEHLYDRLAVESPYAFPHFMPRSEIMPPGALSDAGDEIIFSYESSGLWNGMKDAKAAGDYAYCAFNYGLLIVDISDITNPRFVSQVFMPDGDAWRIALDSSFAYVADGYGGLQIVDISDPANPILTATLQTSGYCYDVALSGDYAFLADGAGGFVVVDVSDRSNPGPIAALPLSGETVAISLQGNYAYVCCGNDGLRTVDISDVENPQARGSLTEIGNLLDIETKGNYAFLAAEARGVLSIDISNPDEPFLASLPVSETGALGIAVKDNYAYVTFGSTSGLQIFDISDPLIPLHVGDVLILGSTLGVSVSGDFAFVAGWQSGLHIIDISSPMESYEIGNYFTRGSIESIAADDNYLYVARSGWNLGDGSMQIVKMNENGAPEILSEVVLEGPAAMDVQVAGDYAYVTDVYTGLQVIDIADPSHPFITGNLPIDGHSMKIALFGDTAYVASDSLGLVIIDVSLKGSPQLIGQFDNQGYISGLAADADYVYLADTKSGLQIIDVTNPGQPILRSTVPTPGPAKNVQVDGDFAYLVDGSGEMLVFDITDRQNPVMIQSLSDLDSPVHVEIDDVFAYVMDVFYGIKTYNISEPGNAYNAGSYPTPGYAWDVSIFNGKSVVADYYGLLSLGMQRPELAFSPSNFMFEGNQDGYQPASQALTIENIGAGNLSWRVSNTQPWLSLQPSGGTGNAEITAEPDITGLVEGIYHDTIVISTNAINTPEYVPVQFIVNAPNRPPVFDEITNADVDENSVLAVIISARDEDGPPPRLLAENLPSNSTFNDSGDGSGLFQFNPDFAQAGEYLITFIAVDAVDSLLSDTAIMQITVNNVNRPPAFMSALGDQDILEGEVLAIYIRATDPDGDRITLTCTGKPENAVFIDSSNAAGSLVFEPDYRDVGNLYSVIFSASDNLGGMCSDTVEITVVNRQLEVIRVDPNPPASGVKDILISEPILITFNEGIDENSLDGNFTVESEKGDVFEYSYNPDMFQIVVTSPTSYFSELDTIYITLDIGIIDLAGIPLAEPVQRTILTGPVIYSGDTNDDGVVDERDVLPLGLHWQSTGPVRGDGPDCGWGMSPAHQWDPLSATYADADGSGIINADDICGIAQNWELTHSDKILAKNHDPDLMAALKQVDENILEDMFAGLLDCSESRGRDALLRILGEMIENNNAVLPSAVELDQNFPNPFNPITTISYSLEKRRFVEIDIFNLSGQLVKTLESGIKDAGIYSVTWDGTDDNDAPASSGIYFYRLKTGNQTITKKMLLLK